MTAFSVMLPRVGLALALTLSTPALAQQPLEPPAAQPSMQGDSYILGPGDVLGLTLYGAPELSGQLEVLNDGTIPLPLVGSVRVSGITLPQATYWLKQLMGKEMLRPELQLRVIKPRPIRVALVGEVERPGLYSLSTSETTQTEGGPSISISGLPTVVDAIQKAGGITQRADLREVVLQRRLPGEEVSYKQAKLDLLALIQEGRQSQNPYLFDGDVIRLATADETPKEAIELASVNLSPKQITVYIVGEVERPGPTPLMANTPLVQAIMAAGGPRTWRASKSNVELLRINRNGSATREKFQLKLSEGASNTRNPPLRDGDTVIVNRTALAVASDSINAVGQPLTSVANVFALIKLLNNTN